MSEHKTLTERIAAFRRERASIERTHRAQPYPASIRQRAVELHREFAQWDITERQIALRLGLHIETLRRWTKNATSIAAPTQPPPPPPAPLPVTVVETQPAALLRGPSPMPPRPVRPSPGVTLVSPQGWRIENLDIAQVVAVLERLGVRAPC